ncbi:hypothetical protein NM688_g2401 [Phlebia brevispora]|uniref:Uncharacterized protein n=1 Tax=Phlebia brevispora TaxID=194682 RepID=A0ACC1T8L0_9APHY|nr:hypothetical protein NM688_g2401 [Phlebia brevispora]
MSNADRPKDISSDEISKYIESLVDKNKRDGRVDPDYWTQTLSGDRRERVTEPLHEVVIYSDEQQREGAELEISLQIKHTTTNPVIPSSLASTPCASLGVDGLLKELNKIMRTSYPRDLPGLLPHLEQCIEHDYDFGTAYGRLRQQWYEDFTTLQEILESRERQDGEYRRSAVANKDVITYPYLMARRAWDLYCNRVVPTWVTRERAWGRGLWTISHSWMAEDSREYVSTPINGHEWRVPLPKGMTLDRVRVELLNLGAEYVWLDVVCLRQEDEWKPEMEAVRVEEWKLDVPTIGNIYGSHGTVVTYFEGLGRPFHIGDIDGERHWINRAWTFQEARGDTIIGGLTPKSPFPPEDHRHDPVAERFYGALGAILKAASSCASYNSDSDVDIFFFLKIMLKRKASFGMDKIAGLNYMTLPPHETTLPVYIRDENNPNAEEEAWSRLLRIMRRTFSIQLVFKYPARGDGLRTWRPSWRQLISQEIPLPHGMWHGGNYGGYEQIMESGSYHFPAHVLRDCIIENLDKPDAEGHCRQGTLTVKTEGKASVFTVTAHHQYLIPDDRHYVLVAPWGHTEYWLVGMYTSVGAIEKVSVVEMEDRDDRERLCALGLVVTQGAMTSVTLM